MGVLLGSIHVVALARNNPILSHLEEPTRGDVCGLKPEDILSIHHQSALWPNQELSLGPVPWAIQELQRNQACKVVEVQELSKLLEKCLGDLGCLRWSFAFLELIRDEGSIGL